MQPTVLLLERARACLVLTLLLPFATCQPTSDPVVIDASGRLVLSRAVEEGETIIRVPRESVLSKDSAQDGSLLAYLDPFEGPAPRGLPHWAALPDEFVLMLQLALHSRDAAAAREATGAEGSEPPWSAWLEQFGRQANGTTHWSAAQREWLEGSQVLRHEAEHARRLAWQLDTLLPPLLAHDPTYFRSNGPFSHASMRELAHVVTAHALVLPETRRPVLLPLPALPIEHGGGAVVSFNVTSGGVEVRAVRALGAGAAVVVEASGYEQPALMVRQGHPGVTPRRCAASSISAAMVDAVLGGTGSGVLELTPLR